MFYCCVNEGAIGRDQTGGGNVNRRSFIKYCLAGGAAVSLGAYAWFYRQNMKENSGRAFQNNLRAEGVSDAAAKILYLASLAPSGHNAQPWTVTIMEPDYWVIGSERKRWLSAVDSDNREMVLSIGAFLENLSRAAAGQGYAATITVVGENTFSDRLAAVRLTALMANAQPQTSDEIMQRRRTIRKNLRKEAFSAADINALLDGYGDFVSYYPMQSEQGEYLSTVTLQANEKQAYREDAQQELADWIRWNERDAAHGNGLTPASMEMSAAVRWYASQFMTRQDVLSSTFKAETVKMAKEQVRSGAGWLVVRSAGSAVEELIRAGRTLQAIWLRACAKDIAIHPMTQALEEAPWQAQVTAQLGKGTAVQFILRAGYVDAYEKPVSLRMPVERFVHIVRK